MSGQVVILRVAKGSPAPEGFEFVRSTRSGDIYHKKLNVVTKEEVDDLTSLFGSIGIDNVAVIPVSEEDHFLNSFAGLTLGGAKKTRKSRKNKSTKK